MYRNAATDQTDADVMKWEILLRNILCLTIMVKADVILPHSAV